MNTLTISLLYIAWLSTKEDTITVRKNITLTKLTNFSRCSASFGAATQQEHCVFSFLTPLDRSIHGEVEQW